MNNYGTEDNIPGSGSEEKWSRRITLAFSHQATLELVCITPHPTILSCQTTHTRSQGTDNWELRGLHKGVFSLWGDHLKVGVASWGGMAW